MTDEEILSVYREYLRWKDMQHRCNSQKNYADRGIKVCLEWKGREGFLRYYRHVSQLPHFGEEGYSLDRIDNDGNYEPNNVQWADVKTQANNRRCTCRDQGQTLEEIANETGIPLKTLQSRYKTGKRGDELRNPVIGENPRKLFENEQSLMDIANATNLPITTVRNRWKAGDRGAHLRREKERIPLRDDNGERISEIAKAIGVSYGVIKHRYYSGDRGARLRRPLGMKKDDYPNE